MPSRPEVTLWIQQLKAGDRAAVERLWQAYFGPLVRLARKRLGDLPRRASDEEDVALSAFDSFCRGAEQGGFARLEGRDDLWQLLAVLTARKAADLFAREGALKRGGGEVRGESAFARPTDDPAALRGIEQVVDRELTPAEVAELVEEYRRLLDRLGDDVLRRVAVWKLEGYSNQEIAARLGCSRATVERKLQLIRHTWEREGRA